MRQAGITPILIVLVVLFLSIAIYFGHKNFIAPQNYPSPNTSYTTPSPMLTNFNKISFKIGNFNFNTNLNYVYIDPSKTAPKTRVSDTKNYGTVGGDCFDAVGGISTFVIETKMKNSPDQSFAGFVSIDTWDKDNITFVNDNIKNKFISFENNLSNLKNVSGTPIEQNTPDFDTGKFLYCSGIFSIPIYVQKIESAKFDSVFYAEVIEGNGTYYTPSMKLVINEKGNWLIFTEAPPGIEHLYDYSSCDNSNSNKSMLTCVIQTWRKNYRNQSEIDNWVSKTLDSLTFNR